ncbi:mannose-1-phosphate guanylyltransferase/mannose-6-phosphate isomerase [Gammaproteobacteria bacterium]|nr:mannose-1-phosphate guanylyltransferase/mannose-6-phosphate isomerase [Gammaproteobacteria bacterium]
MEKSNKAVILCGGEGLRLWPLSRSSSPKHLISLDDSKTFLQNTVKRINEIFNLNDIIIITNEKHKYEIIGQLYDEYKENIPQILCEPEPKNTLAAIAYAAKNIYSTNPSACITVFPADHFIDNNTVFKDTILSAQMAANKGYFVTIGIKPDRPHTGYGYIKTGDIIDSNLDKSVIAVQRFIEKPNIKQAKNYIKEGCLWNSGIFTFNLEKFFIDLKLFQPEISLLIDNINEDNKNQIYQKLDSISIDTGLVEKISDIAVVCSDMEWNDLGEWNSIFDFSEQNNNSLKGNVHLDDVSESLIWNYNGLAMVSGIKNLIIVNTPDCLLVMNRESSDNLKNNIEVIKKKFPSYIEQSNKVHRPWGYYIVIKDSADYKVKKIAVRPKGKLSLQAHEHRSEHWIVVKGTATVINDNKEFNLKTGESTFIPVNTQHRLINNHDDILEIIEVQTGTYFGEDDIHRYDDAYDRIK